MSFDQIIFRGLVPGVLWRHVAEAPSFWEEVCSSLAGIAECAGATCGCAPRAARLCPAVESPQGFH